MKVRMVGLLALGLLLTSSAIALAGPKDRFGFGATFKPIALVDFTVKGGDLQLNASGGLDLAWFRAGSRTRGLITRFGLVTNEKSLLWSQASVEIAPRLVLVGRYDLQRWAATGRPGKASVGLAYQFELF